MLSRVESFENGDSAYSCGGAKTEVFKYDDVMPWFKARSSAHTTRKRYVWTQIFFRYGGKNLRFRKYPSTCRRDLSLNLGLNLHNTGEI